jgi:hypothetical protein
VEFEQNASDGMHVQWPERRNLDVGGRHLVHGPQDVDDRKVLVARPALFEQRERIEQALLGWRQPQTSAVELDLVDDDAAVAGWYGAAVVGANRHDDHPVDEGQLARVGRRGRISLDVGVPERGNDLLGM